MTKIPRKPDYKIEDSQHTGKKIKNICCEMWVEDGIFYYECIPGVIIDTEAAWAIYNDRLTLFGDHSYPAFGDVRGVKYWTTEARKLGADKNYCRQYKAIAVLINSSVQRIIFNFFIHYFTMPVPVKLFTSKGLALTWLQKFK